MMACDAGSLSMTEAYSLRRRHAIRVLLATALFTGPALGAPSAGPVPDLSGVWAREFIGFDPPASASGHGPIANLSRMPGGQANINTPVGDYNDPIFTPKAATIVKSRGEISLSGENFPQPANQCQP